MTQINSEFLHLYDAVCKFSSNRCENPRDKIYGLLGIVATEERIEVDYSLSTREVFLRAVEKMLKVSNLSVIQGDIGTDEYGFRPRKFKPMGIKLLHQLQRAERMQQNLEQLADNMGVGTGI
jgi:hypothetical protein